MKLECFRGSVVNMRRRLLVYLLLIMFTMFAGFILLSLFGVFKSDFGEVEKIFSNELNRLSENISKQYGAASVQAARMSEQVSLTITGFMEKEKLSATELKNRPELLEPLQKILLNILLINLYSAEFSGAFITLDTTVNPNIAGAENSKAGLYIRSIEPNIGRTGTEMRYLLRGFPSLAGDGYINFQAKWDLEFDVKNQLFWIEPLKAYVSNPSLPLSRLLYWCFMSPVQGLNENVLICSVPVFDNAGRVLGICGFEISEMNFMLRHEPNISGFHNAVFLFSSANNGQFRLEDALFSGNNAVYNTLLGQEAMRATGKAGELSIYDTNIGASFVGIDKEIRLCTNDSPFAGSRFAAALVVPSKDFYDIVSGSRLRLVLICAALLCAGIALSLFLSDRYEKPFKELLEALRSGDMNAKSQIKEIDDLLEFLRSQLNEPNIAGTGVQERDNENAEKPSEFSTEYMLNDFIENTKKLSRAEADVFILYLEGYTAEEIALMLSLSINTIKTHNRRIFAKLNVSSRKELLTWVQVLTTSGRSLDDSQQKQLDKIRSIVKNMKESPDSDV